MTDSLLAHVVAKFSSRQWENIATESLLYLLQGNARTTPARVLAPYLSLPTDIHWHSQIAGADDTGIPDLVGRDADGRPVVLIEGKFWAPLTRHQPASYLRWQASHFVTGPGMGDSWQYSHALVFLVPAARQALIAHELEQRTGWPSRHDSAAGVMLLEREQLVLVLSWRRMLAEVRTSLQEAADHAGLADLAQLEGLCDRADRQAMLPFSTEDVDTATARRVWDFYDLADLVTDELVRRGRTSTKSRSSAGGKGYYNRGQLVPRLGYDVTISVAIWSWADRYPTPLWLRVWQPSAAMLEAGRRVERQRVTPYAAHHGNWLQFALPIPFGVSADVAVSRLSDRVEAILKELPPAPNP